MSTVSDGIELASWRRRLMPFAIVMILFGSAFFIWVSYQQFSDIAGSIKASSGGNEIVQVIIGDQGAANPMPMAEKAQLLMAERAQRANLSRASASLLVSLWTRNMGFVTGMILAMVGATFILSRLDDAGSQLSAEQGMIKGSLKTSSPGIVLVVLGTVLMVIAMSVRYTESGKDSSQTAAATAPSNPPVSVALPEDGPADSVPADGADPSPEPPAAQ
ncbi:MAG: hypothetical protein ACRCUI_04215 [Polymorphobacter sp.]